MRAIITVAEGAGYTLGQDRESGLYAIHKLPHPQQPPAHEFAYADPDYLIEAKGRRRDGGRLLEKGRAVTTKHTPGPWVCYDSAAPDYPFTVGAGGEPGGFECETIALVKCVGYARLIAAAPDLLAALEYIVANSYGFAPRGVTWEPRDRALAAIAKAECRA